MPTLEEVKELSKRYMELLTSLEQERQNLDPKMKTQKASLDQQIATLQGYANGMQTRDYNAYMNNYQKLYSAVLRIETLRDEQAISRERYADTVEAIRGKQETVAAPAPVKKHELNSLKGSTLDTTATQLENDLTQIANSLKKYTDVKANKKPRTYSSNATDLQTKCKQWETRVGAILKDIKQSDAASEMGIRTMLAKLLTEMKDTLQTEQKQMGHHFFKSEYTGIVKKATAMVEQVEQMVQPEAKVQPRRR